MFLIRTVEEMIRKIYPLNEIKTPVHLAIGQEAIAVGVCSALQKNNQIFGTYRNHGIYLAQTNESDKFFGEMFGKSMGLSKGKAGSMHIMAPEHNLMGTSAIVASMIPVAVGAAFSNQYKGTKQTVVVFFGDGAVDEGVFWESLNFACLKKLPIVFVYEDNNYAIHSHQSKRHGYQSITNIVKNFDCHVIKSNTTDVEKIYKLTKKALMLQSRSPKPVFMHLEYYRYLEHVGVNQDFIFGYRTEKEFKRWLKNDPLMLQKKKLIKNKHKEEELQRTEKEIVRAVEKSISTARNAPYPDNDELYTDLLI
jgi:TPP-dependent pyruvate/acetoin dehydrogenase alpha subunit